MLRFWWIACIRFCLAWIMVCASTASSPALANDQDKKSLTWRDVWKWREAWTGADASRDAWLIYSGVTVAPFGHIHEDGWRLRVAGGYGGYKYGGLRRPPEARPSPFADDGEPVESQRQNFKAQTYFTDILAGYLAKWGPLTAKAFAGASIIDHSIAPFDSENIAIGDEFGAKGTVELWLNIGAHAFASLDVTYASAHDTRSVRTRVGYRFGPSISAGFESGINLDAQSDCDLGWSSKSDCDQQFSLDSATTSLLDYSRGGAFVRHEWDGGEVSASAGVTGGVIRSSGDEAADPYVTINYITQW